MTLFIITLKYTHRPGDIEEEKTIKEHFMTMGQAERFANTYAWMQDSLLRKCEVVSVKISDEQED